MKWKLGKIPPDAGNKDAKIALRVQVKSLPAALSCGWTEEEEEEERLLALQQPLTIEDTALGKERRNIKQDSFAAIGTMNAAELGALIEAALEAQARVAAEELTIVGLSDNEVAL